MEEAQKGVVPENTKKATEWALRVFHFWQVACNDAGANNNQCPEDILLTEDGEALSKCICYFCMEVRKANREPYTPRTILQILAGLLRYMREQKKHAFNLIDSKAFPELHRLLDSLFRNLHSQGVGTDRKQAKVIGFDEERQLWASGALSTDTPRGLLNAVFYYNGVNLALRGGDEHKGLKLSQMVIKAVQDPDDPSKEIDCLVYMEHGSKNRPGNSKQVNLENKVVTQFSKPKLVDKCYVQLVKKYISKLPPIAFQKDVFYWRPKILASASLPDHV